MALTVVHDWRGAPETARGAACALGNFDGVHRGHRSVIATARARARASGAPCGVISFEPHPRRWFTPAAEPFRVTTPGQQARILGELGVDIFFVLPFGAELAGMTDETFAREVLAEGLGVSHVTVGFDISFGKGRTGSPERLMLYGAEFGFEVTVVDRIADPSGAKLSSTAVRSALRAGRPQDAAAVLGRPFAIEGVVAHGDKRGRTLGFPTLNVPLGDYVRPAFGVYATRTRLPDGRIAPGVSNLGARPTVGGTQERLETFLFDVDEDLYGAVVETELVAFIRPEMKFEGLEALKAQIAIDATEARAILGC